MTPKAWLFMKNIFSLPACGPDKKGGVQKEMKLYTSAAIARWLDLTERRVRQLRDKKIIEEARPGLYNLLDTLHRYIHYLRKDGTDNELDIDYNTERARLVKAKREKEELELEMQRREVLRAEDVEQVMTDMLLRFRSKLRSLPVKLSPTLATETDQTEIFMILKKATDEALEELADFDKTFGKGAEEDGPAGE